MSARLTAAGVLALLGASPALAQSGDQSPEQIAGAYLAELVAAAEAAAGGQGQALDGAIATASGDERWISPAAGTESGQRAVLLHALIYDGAEIVLGPVQLAQDAARAPVTFHFGAYPDFDWPGRVDFIRTGGEWKIRDVRLILRRPLPVEADAEETLASFTAQMARHAEALRAAQEEGPAQTYLRRHWMLGGGYWALPAECADIPEYFCALMQPGNAAPFTAVSTGADRSFEAGALERSEDTASARITVTTPRRTFTGTQNWTLTLEHSPRYGWEVTAAEPDETAPAQAAADLAIAPDGSAVSLVEELLAAVLGEDAPDAAQAIQASEQLDPYFAETQAGRRTQGRMLTMRPLLEMGGGNLDWTVTRTGANSVQAVVTAAGGRTTTLNFVIEEASGDPRIADMEVEQ
jgi:hypothetical protein